jgi:hypothetical protein
LEIGVEVKATPLTQSVKMKKELLVPTSWWNSTKATIVGNLGPLGGMLLDQAMTSKATLYSGHCQGFLEHPDLEEGKKYLLEALVEKTGAHTPYTEGPIFGRGTFDTWLTWDTGAIQIKIGLDNKLSVTVSCLDENTYMLVADTLGEHILPDHVRQPVYSLAEGPQGVEIIEVGLAGQDFEDDNYEAETVEGFYSIAAELQRDNPIGRLVILEGSPGSGKTFLVRGLIHEVLDAIFVLVPPHLVDSLAGPQLVPMLVRARGMAGTNRPIVLVIEDMIREVKHEVRKLCDTKGKEKLEPNWAYLRNSIRDEVGEYLFQKTERRPMVLPVIMEI